MVLFACCQQFSYDLLWKMFTGLFHLKPSHCLKLRISVSESNHYKIKRHKTLIKTTLSNNITRYFNVKREVDGLKEEIVGKKYKKVVYKGQPTKDFKKLYKLTNRMHRLNIERCNTFATICRTKFDPI